VNTLPDCWHTSLYQILRPWLLLAQLQAVPLRQSSRHWQPCKKRCLQLKISEWTKETVLLSSLLIFQISKYLKFWNTPVYRPVIYFAAFLCKGKFREGFIVNLRQHKTKVLSDYKTVNSHEKTSSRLSSRERSRHQSSFLKWAVKSFAEGNITRSWPLRESCVCLYTSQVAQQAGAYPGFCSMERLKVFPSNG